MKINRAFSLGIIFLIGIFGVVPARGQIIESQETSATVGASRWLKLEIDNRPTAIIGANSSIAVDPVTNLAYITSYNESSQMLAFAMERRDGLGLCGPGGNTWSCVTMGGLGAEGLNSSIDVRTIGETTYVAMSYFNATEESLHIISEQCINHNYDDCEESFEVIHDLPTEDVVGRYSAVKIDANGKTSIAYTLNGEIDHYIIYATQVDNGGEGCIGATHPDLWTCEVVDSDADNNLYYTSLDLDYNGDPHIAYYVNGLGLLRYAWHSSGTGCNWVNDWSCKEIDGDDEDAGKFASIAAPKSADDVTRIAYYDATWSTLKYAEGNRQADGDCGGGDFNCATIDWLSDKEEQPSLDLVVVGEAPYIAYHYVPADLMKPDELRIARRYPLVGNCGPEEVAPPPLPPVMVHNWLCATIDHGGLFKNVGLNPSIAADSSGNLHVSYQQRTYLPEDSDGWLMLAFQGNWAFLPSVGKVTAP